MLNRAQDQNTTITAHLRGGEGDVMMHHLMKAEDSCGKFKMCAILMSLG